MARLFKRLARMTVCAMTRYACETSIKRPYAHPRDTSGKRRWRLWGGAPKAKFHAVQVFSCGGERAFPMNKDRGNGPTLHEITPGF